MVDRRCDHTYAAAAARRSCRRMARTPCRAPPWSPARAAPLGWAARGPRCGQARQATMSDDYDTHLQGIVCISGTSRPDNYTARALGIVVDELQHRRVAPVVFDART